MAPALKQLPASLLAPLADLGDDANLAEVIRTRRAGGRARCGDLALPTRRDEAWKFTSLDRLGKIDFALAPAANTAGPALALDGLPQLAGPRVVLINGRFAPDLSDLSGLPDRVLFGALSVLANQIPGDLWPTGAPGDALAALNDAYLADGLVLLVPADVVVEQPLQLISLGHANEQAVMFHPRVLISLGTGAKLSLLESHIGDSTARYFSNIQGDIRLAPSAELHHARYCYDGAAAINLGHYQINLAAKAIYHSASLNLAGGLSRFEQTITIAGAQAEAHAVGAYLADGQRHVDNTLLIDHVVGHACSRQLFKGVLTDHGHGVFQGKVLVRRDAQKTDAHQLNKALLLSDHAEIDSKPELEIYADDVKCAHGATVGDLDAEALFYLRSRGIDPAVARLLLVEGFLEEALDAFPNDAIRAALTDQLRQHLAKLGEVA